MGDVERRDLWQRFDLLEQDWCLKVNRGCRYRSVRSLFAVISRLGDGVFWYILMLALAASGEDGAKVAAQMALTGLAGLFVYKQLKHRLVRERPYIALAAIQLGAAPLDRYSFPRATPCTRWPSRSSPRRTFRRSRQSSGPSRCWWPCRAWCSGCTTRPTSRAGALIGAALATTSLSYWPG